MNNIKCFIPPFGIYPTRTENQVPCQEQVHKSDLQSPRSPLGEPKPTNVPAIIKCLRESNFNF